MTDLAAAQKVEVQEPAHGISFNEALLVWLRVAILSFGGPAGQIAVMHRILVEEKNWISEGRFLHALNYCMLLPGPEAQQLATYIGWLLHRTIGGIVDVSHDHVARRRVVFTRRREHAQHRSRRDQGKRESCQCSHCFTLLVGQLWVSLVASRHQR